MNFIAAENRLGRLLIVMGTWALLLSFLAGALLAADLDDGQKKMLADAKNHLKQAAVNVELAQQAAGSASNPATGTRAKLALSRLAGAKGSIAEVSARLAKLPADHADVKEVKKQSDAASGLITEMEGWLTAKPAPAAPDAAAPAAGSGAAPPATPAAADGTVKLDYKQVQLLKDANYFIDEIAGKAEALAEVIATAKKTEDQTLVDHRLIRDAMGTIGGARQKQKNVEERFKALPADGKGVPSASAAFKKAIADIDAAEKILTPLNEKLTKLVAPATYPTLDTDLKRLGELTSMYKDLNVLTNRRERAAEAVMQSTAAKAEHDRLMKAYAALIHQQTDEGKRMEGAGKYFTESFNAFTEAAKKQKESLPGEIDGNLAEANKMADEAVAESKPAFFTNGIVQRMEWAQDRLALYAALDPEGAKGVQAKIAATQQQLKKRQAALRDAIIASNELPPDRYRGNDRAELERLATEAWKKIQPEAKVLGTRIPSQEWERDLIWRRETVGEWYKIDRSKLQVQLLVQLDDKVVVIRPINLWKDHLKNDQINAVPMDGKDDELIPQRLLVRQKVK